jgi:adenylate kinase family enzyme
MRNSEYIRIAFSGKISSGKTTAAKVLVDNYGFVRHSFADELKKHVAWRKRVDLQYLLDHKEEFRDTLQEVGHKMRDKDENFWVSRLVKNLPEDVNVVCDDLRYLNEAERLKQLGFYLVRIDTLSQTIVERRKQLGLRSIPRVVHHVSETSLDDYYGWDYRIVGDVPKFEFELAVKATLGRIMWDHYNRLIDERLLLYGRS